MTREKSLRSSSSQSLSRVFLFFVLRKCDEHKPTQLRQLVVARVWRRGACEWCSLGKRQHASHYSLTHLLSHPFNQTRSGNIERGYGGNRWTRAVTTNRSVKSETETFSATTTTIKATVGNYAKIVLPFRKKIRGLVGVGNISQKNTMMW